MRSARQKRSLLILATLLLCSGSAASDSASQTKEKDAEYAKKGHTLYNKYCGSCHGTSAAGDGVAASSLKVHPADLTAISQRYNGFPEEKVMDYIDGEKYAIGHGSRTMPVWGTRLHRGDSAAQGDVYALTKYLASIQKH